VLIVESCDENGLTLVFFLRRVVSQVKHHDLCRLVIGKLGVSDNPVKNTADVEGRRVGNVWKFHGFSSWCEMVDGLDASGQSSTGGIFEKRRKLCMKNLC
jgi:hypothetical protein